MANYRSKRQARRAPKSGRLKASHSSPAWLWLLTGMFVGILGATTTYMVATEKWTLSSSKKAPLSTAELNNEIAESKTKPKASAAPSSVNPKAPPITQRFEFYHLLPGMEVPIPDADHTTIPEPTSQASKWNPGNPKTAEKNEDKSRPLKPTTLATKPLTITPAKPVGVTPKPITATVPTISQKATGSTPPAASIIAPKLNKPERSATPLGSVAPSIPPKAAFPNSNLPQVQRKLAAAQYLIQVSTFRTANQAEELKARLVLQGFRPHIQKVRIQDNIWFRVTLGPFSTETMALKQKKQLERHHIRGILFLQR